MPQILYQESCASTNDTVAEIFRADDISCVYTFCQTSGRGQYGNSWAAECGKNLAVSFAVPRDFIKIPEVLFNYHTALIVRNFVANLTAEKVFIKWPNDIILKNKKICGILIEVRKDFYTVGIGINVLQKNFEKLPSAGSLSTQTGMDFDIENFAKNFIENFCDEILKNREILEPYNFNLFKKDIPAVFEFENQRQNGIIQFADEEGFLHIDLENSGLKKFRMKEVKMLY